MSKSPSRKPSKAGAPKAESESQVDEGTDSEEEPKEAKALAKADNDPPLNIFASPAGSAVPTQVAVGMQLMMQRSSLDQLSPDVQKELIKTADTLDERGYNFSCRRLDEKAAVRRWTVIPVCFFALLVIVGGFYFANKLIDAGDFDKAWTMLLGGFAVISALLGGAGLTGILKNLGQS